MGGLDRRAFLRSLAGGAIGVSAASVLLGCSEDDGTVQAQPAGVTGTSTTTSAPPPPTTAPFDPEVPWWLQGGFEPVTKEVDGFDLDITGASPPELDGLFVRNGSNPRTKESPHWFLGDGMLHGVRFEAGRAAWYRNRYVRTPLYEAKAQFGETPPGGDVTQSNVSVIHHGGRLLTLGEVGLPFEVRTDDLSTIGAHDYAGRLTTSMTAHPKVDQATGDLHFFGYGFVPPYLTYHVASPDGSLRTSQEIAVAGPTMIHDFAITEHHAVFWELPVVFDLDAAIAGEDFPFRWDPGYGARIGIVPLGGPATETRWVEIEPCYVFHGVNAWEDRGEVVIDVCRHASMFAAGTTALGNEDSDLRRWRVATGGPGLSFRDEVLEGDLRLELPSVDRRRTGLPARYSYLLETKDDPDTVVFAGIARRDERTGSLDRWEASVTEAPGEVTFVPRGEGSDDGDGWLLTYTVDLARDRSDLVVLDAADVGSGPIARIDLPQRVPFGFHGTWVPSRVLS